MTKSVISVVVICTMGGFLQWSCVRKGTSAPSASRPTLQNNQTQATSRPVSSAPPNQKVRQVASFKPTSVQVGQYQRATFAAGCFWCIQPPFDKLKGVIRTSVGYTGGIEKNPTYKQVAYGLTKHTEAIEVIFDPKIVSYRTLLKVFWTQIDPTVTDRQFVDVGMQYRASIFYHSDEQRKLAEESKQQIEKAKCFTSSIVTPIVPASRFYAAEDYHQKFYIKSPYRYRSYRSGSGRDLFIRTYWQRCRAFGD